MCLWIFRTTGLVALGFAWTLALCGGGLWGKHRDQTFTPVPGPYWWKVFTEKFDEQLMTIDSKVEIDGTFYSAFAQDGLVGSEIYLGRLSADGQSYEEVWPTGLTDVRGYPVYDGWVGLEEPIGPVTLAHEGAKLFISHHVPMVEPLDNSNYTTIVSAEYVRSERSLLEILRDTDTDGLTDITESLLMTDPSVLDSDDDGYMDANDACPNVDVNKHSYLARGILRAVDAAGGASPPLSYPGSIFPFKTVYLWIEGDVTPADGTAAVLEPGVRCVLLHTQELRGRYEAALNHDRAWNRVWIKVVKLGSDHKLHDSSFNTSIDENTVFTGDYIVDYGFGNSGQWVELDEKDGELYPSQLGPIWLAD